MIGIHISEFWELTVGQFLNCIDGYSERQSTQMKLQDRLNYILGNYIACAYHDPKHYPKKPLLEQQEHKNNIMTDEMLDNFIIANYERQKKGKHGRKD